MSDTLSSSELEKLFKEWYKLKAQLKRLEREEERIKKLVHRQMDLEDSNKISSRNYMCSRRNMIRDTLSKRNVPRDVWDQYKTSIKVKQLILKRYDDEEEEKS